MSDLDWTAPAKSEPPPSKLHPWKVDVDKRSNFTSGVAIYEVPERTPGLDVHVRFVASFDREEDARLVADLYERHRRTQ